MTWLPPFIVGLVLGFLGLLVWRAKRKPDDTITQEEFNDFDNGGV
jgi:hypothetical protein